MAFTYGSITNATAVGHGTRSEYQVRLGYQVNSQSIQNNTSNITLRLEARTIKSNYITYGYNQTTTIDGVSLGAKTFDMININEWLVFGSRTFDVKHDDFGQYSSTKSGSFTTNANVEWALQSGSASVKVAPPKIPRASTISCSSPYIGDTAIITIDKKVESFTSTVTYEIGTLTETIAEKTSEKVLSLDTNALKEQIYALMSDAKELEAKIKCETYNGDTKIGDTQEASFNLYAKESECRPEVSGTITDTNEATASFGKLVKYLSKPKVTIEATPKYSSSIKTYSINLNDGQSSTLQEDTFESIGSNSITINAIDSRGYGNPKTLTVEMIDYVKLHIDNIDISRTEDVSKEVILNANGVWFNGKFNDENTNALTARFQYNVGEGWVEGGTITPTIEGNTFKFTNVSLGNIYDFDSEYQFKIIISDSLMTTGNADKETITVPKGIAVVEIGEDLVNVNGSLTKNDIEVPISKNEKSESEIDTYSCDYFNKKEQWNIIGTTTSTNSIELPNDFNELYIMVEYGSANNIIANTIVPKVAITDAERDITVGGRFQSSTYGMSIVGIISSSTFKLKNAYINSANEVGETTTTIYYR